MKRRTFLKGLLGIWLAPAALVAAPAGGFKTAPAVMVKNAYPEGWYGVIHPDVEMELRESGFEIGQYSNIRWIRTGRLAPYKPQRRDPQWYRAYLK